MPTIRPAAGADAPAIAAIYAHHVLHGTATFDIVPPGEAEWIDRIAAIAARGWPFLVAEVDGAVAGYAYAAQFRDRPAYAEAARTASMSRLSGLAAESVRRCCRRCSPHRTTPDSGR